MIKLNLSKAYDCIIWDYLMQVLDAFGCVSQWISWIHSLISSHFFYVLLNGSPFSPFSSSCCLCQGDPLSCFMFIIVMEGLGQFINFSISQGHIKGFKIFWVDLPITHQNFVDDVRLFGPLSLMEDNGINAFLQTFMVASKTQINKDKTSIFFFNCKESIQCHLKCVLQFCRAYIPSKYMGVL